MLNAKQKPQFANLTQQLTNVKTLPALDIALHYNKFMMLQKKFVPRAQPSSSLMEHLPVFHVKK